MADEDTILSHGKRAELRQYILLNPGIQFRQLMRHFSLSEGTLRYHLWTLVKNKKIRSCLKLGTRCYYPYHYKPIEIEWDQRIKHIKLDESQRRVLSIIDEMIVINQKDLARLMGLGRFKLRKIMRELMDQGFVRDHREGKEVHYTKESKEEIRREVLRLLVTDLLREDINEETYLKARRALDKELF